MASPPGLPGRQHPAGPFTGCAGAATGPGSRPALAAVEPGSPLKQGGLLLGDTIVAVEGSAVQQHDDLLPSSALTGRNTCQNSDCARWQVQEMSVVIGETELVKWHADEVIVIKKLFQGTNGLFNS